MQTPEEVEEKYFPGFLVFIDSTEQQQIPRQQIRNTMRYTIQAKTRKNIQ